MSGPRSGYASRYSYGKRSTLNAPMIAIAVSLVVFLGVALFGLFSLANPPASVSYSVPASAGPSTGHDWNAEQRTNALYGAALTQCNAPSVTATVSGGVYVATVRCPK